MHFKKEISLKEFLKFLAPSVLVMIFISTYVIIDGFFISRYVGSEALAAVNLIIPVNSVIFSIGLMFAAGGGALTSIKLGENDKKTASRYFSNLLVVAIGFGVIATIVSIFFRANILGFLGVNSSLWNYANIYSLFTFITFPFLIGKIIFAGFLRAEGNPKAALILAIVGGVANIIMDYIFIVLLDMGVAGAGLATMLGYVVSLIYGARYFSSPKSTFRFGFHKIDRKFLSSVIFNGSSEMVSELAIGFTVLVFNLLCLKYAGNNGVAAISVILYINLLVGNSFYGFAMGTAPLISYYYGKKDTKTLRNVRRYALNSMLIASPVIVAFIFFSKSLLVSIFFDASNPAFNLAVNGLSVFAFGFLLTGYNMFGSSMFTALSNGKISAFISFTKSFVVFAAIAYLLPLIMGVEGIWLIMPVVELTIAFLVFYLTREQRMRKYYIATAL
ncbi:MAG: MATE family efflux transporter [Bacteroidales bacterium]|jgi:putative MATE family efflux protein|nr:MATE family efflux transporter [Bacteroidales bacterium]